MNTSNRPTIKVTEYELQWKASKKMYWKELNAENTDWSDIQNFPTGNTRIIERPMNNTEYIEYLENSIELFGFERVRDDKLSKEMIVSLRKQNQELKEHNINQRKAFAILLNEEEDKYKKEFRELNDKLLKIVESVCENEIGRHTLDYLLQEIKSAMEKGKE